MADRLHEDRAHPCAIENRASKRMANSPFINGVVTGGALDRSILQVPRLRDLLPQACRLAPSPTLVFCFSTPTRMSLIVANEAATRAFCCKLPEFTTTGLPSAPAASSTLAL